VLNRPEPEWQDVGPIDDLDIGETRAVAIRLPKPVAWAGPASLEGVFLRRTASDSFEAFQINCTHLGCPIHWLDSAQLFMCPCHGGVFYSNGDVATGPPKDPLPRHEVRVRNGRVEVRTKDIAITGSFPNG
jgi:menaquinol-cytochrome c reductase iron-sulfur subunit